MYRHNQYPYDGWYLIIIYNNVYTNKNKCMVDDPGPLTSLVKSK